MSKDSGNSTLLIFVVIIVLVLGGIGLYMVFNSTPVSETTETGDSSEEAMENDDAMMENDDAMMMEEESHSDDRMMEDDDSMMMEEDLATIAATASSTTDLSTLVTALDAAGLVPTFADETASFTVLAPTNQAFANIQETVDALLQDPTGQLTTVLQYHVISGMVMSTDLTDGMVVPTLAGQELTVNVNGSIVTFTDVNGNVSTVTAADVKASNGIVHIIDTVLVPQL